MNRTWRWAPFTPTTTRRCQTVVDYSASIIQLCRLGCTRRLLRRLKITLPRFLELHFAKPGPAYVAALVLARGVSLRHITSESMSLAQLLERGCPVLFRVVRRETTSERLATESVIAGGYRVEELLTDGLSSEWFQQRLKNSHLDFRAAGFTEDSLLRLGYASRLLNRG